MIPTTFAEFAALGYTRLVPIIPHDAPISEGSSLFKRVGTKQDSRGKAVGVRGLNGWYGYDWLNQPEPDASDLARWQRMGAGVGIMTGGPLNLVLVDADTLDQACAGKVMIAGMKHLGPTPVRIGRAPKAGYLIRVTEPIQYCRVDFGPLNDEGRRIDRVELLSDGRQFVAHGVHPKTLQPYVWTTPLCRADQLPIVTPQQLAAFMDELRRILPNTGPLVTEGATTEVSQASLRGDIEKVRAAVAATPNTSAAFGTREAYRDFGYAIKAALPDDEPEAFEIFADWCSRWEDGENDPDIVAADWRRMKPPFRRGASWIYELAEETSGGKFKRADAFFDVLPDEPESLFPRDTPPAPERAIEPLIAVDPTTWAGKTPRPREWVVEGWMPKGEVTLLYGDGGVGKSLLAMQFAACAATGRPWLGQVTQPSRVMGFFCEDSEDELFRRQADINRALGIECTDLSNLRLFPRKHSNNVFALWDRQTGALKLQPVWYQLADAAKSFGADVLIVDTIADIFAGSEIDRAQVSAFVKSCLGRLALEIGGSVLALGHPSVSGRASGEGTSGSTAWSNAARSRLYLQRPKGADRGSTRVLKTMKANYSPKGAELIIRYQHGAFETVAGLQPAATVAPRLGAPPVVSIGEAAEQAIVSVLAVNPAERINMKPNSQYFAIKVLRALDPDSLAPFDDAKVERAMTDLLRRGAIREQQVGRDGSGRPTFGYVVVPENMGPLTPVELADAPDIAATIFD